MKETVFRFVKMEKEHLPFVVSVRNSCRYVLHDGREFSESDTKEWFTTKNPNWWMIEKSGDIIGYFRTSKWDYENGSVFIGADLAFEWRGKGIGTKIYPLFMSMINDEYGISDFYVRVFHTNSAAKRVYEKVGFKPVQETNNDILMRKTHGKSNTSV